MNTTENNIIDLSKPVKSNKKLLMLFSKIFVAGLVVIAISVSAVKIANIGNEPNYPANTDCLNALTAASDSQKAYAEQMENALQGKPVATVDLSAVTNSAQECQKNKAHTTIKVD